jgi:signal transduction histidine kinase
VETRKNIYRKATSACLVVAIVAFAIAVFLAPPVSSTDSSTGWLAFCALLAAYKIVPLTGGLALDGSLFLLAGWAAAAPQQARVLCLVGGLVFGVRLAVGDKGVQFSLDFLTLASCALVSVLVARQGLDIFAARVALVIVIFLILQLLVGELLLHSAPGDGSVQVRGTAELLRPMRLALSGFLLMTAVLYVESNPTFVALVPIYLYLQKLTKSSLHSKNADRGALATRAVMSVQRQKAVVEERLVETDRKRRLLEGLSEQLLSEPGQEEVFSAVAMTLRSLAPYDGLVFLRLENDSFIPQRGFGQDVAPFEELALADVQLRPVIRAHQTRQPVKFESKDPNPVGDRSALAVRLGPEDVLYLGRKALKPFQAKEVETTTWVAEKAEKALHLARKVEWKESNLREKSRDNYRLRNRLKLLSHLQESFFKLSSTIQRDRLMQIIKQVLIESVPHDSGLLVVQDSPLAWSPNAENPQFSEPQVKRLHKESDGRALIFADIGTEKSPFRDLAPGARSLLYTPLQIQNAVLGCIVLVAVEPGCFSGEHRDLLSTISTQCSLALTNAQNYETAVQARRTLEEAQAQLIQASKMGAVGLLAAGLAHEMNTPLGVVAVSIESAESKIEQGQTETAINRLGFAKKAVEKIKVLVQQLLHYSRKSDDEAVEPIDLSKIAQNTIDFVAPTLSRKGVVVTTQLSDHVVSIGRPEEIQQVLSNLLINAADATLLADQTKPIRVSTRVTNGLALLQVQDQGTGIKEEHLDRLFEPFFTTKEVGDGSGLGLSVSYEIVKAHEGKLEVISKPGQGSLFTVSLPLKPSSPGEAP